MTKYEQADLTPDFPMFELDWPDSLGEMPEEVRVADAAIAALVAEAAKLRAGPYRDPDTVRILVTKPLIEQWWTRDAACNRLSVDIGEPDEYGYHEAVIRTHYDDNPLKLAEAEVEKLRWMLKFHLERYLYWSPTKSAESVDEMLADLERRWEEHRAG